MEYLRMFWNSFPKELFFPRLCKIGKWCTLCRVRSSIILEGKVRQTGTNRITTTAERSFGCLSACCRSSQSEDLLQSSAAIGGERIIDEVSHSQRASGSEGLDPELRQDRPGGRGGLLGISVVARNVWGGAESYTGRGGGKQEQKCNSRCVYV